MQRAGERGGIAPDVDGAADLAARLGDRLAGFQRVEPGDVFQPRLDQVGRLEQDRGALGRLHARPRTGLERLVRGLHRGFHFGLAGLCIVRDGEAVAGALALQRAAVAGIDMLAVDQQPVGFWRCGCLGGHGDVERGVHRVRFL